MKIPLDLKAVLRGPALKEQSSQIKYDYRELLSAAPYLAHDCRTLCSRTKGEISPPRCPHGCLKPGARDRAGVVYCSGCCTRLIGINGKGYWTEPTLPTPHQTLGLLNSEIYPKVQIPKTHADRLNEIDPDFHAGAWVENPFIPGLCLGARTPSLNGHPITQRDQIPTGRRVPNKKEQNALEEMARYEKNTAIEHDEITHPKMKWFAVEVPAEWCTPWQPKPRSLFIGPVFDPPTGHESSRPTPVMGLPRIQAGVSGKNGISRDGITPPLTNFCPKCFTRSKMTEHTEGGFKAEAPLNPGLPSRNKWITTRVFVRTEVRYGFNVPQIHACGERVEA